jgi:DNA-binding GntR family transcriptional regulator
MFFGSPEFRSLDGSEAARLTSANGWKGRRPMSVLPIRRASAANTIAAELREALLSGRFAPGTPLVADDLAERVGTHPATVRAALAELERDGLVVHSLQRGLEVAPLTHDELHDIYSARRVYERAGLEAMLGRSPVDVSWLNAAIERMGEAAIAGDERALVEGDIAFHLAIVAAAGSRRLTRSAQGALMDLRLVLSVADRASDDMPALVADHQVLVEVFQTASVSESLAALDDHLVHGEQLAASAL